MSDVLVRSAQAPSEGHSKPGSTVLVVDFGAQYAQLIARRVREARVYSEIVPNTLSVAEILAKRPSAIILSGGPSSVYTPGAPTLDPALLAAGVPVLGICYGFHAMARALGGHVDKTSQREFGRTTATIDPRYGVVRGSARVPRRVDVAFRLRAATPSHLYGNGLEHGGHHRRIRENRIPAVWGAVAPRGGPHRVWPASDRALLVPLRGARARLVHHKHHRQLDRVHPGRGR